MESERKKKKKRKLKETQSGSENKLQQTMDTESTEEMNKNDQPNIKIKRKHVDTNTTQELKTDDLRREGKKEQEDTVPRKKKKKKFQDFDSETIVPSHEKTNKSDSHTNLKTKTVTDSNKLGTENKLMKKLEVLTGKTLTSNKGKQQNDLTEAPFTKKKKNVFKMEETDKVESDVDEDIDPEKEAIRKKKREKRKLKKLEKEKAKEAEKERYGTAKQSAKQYLEQWDTDRDNWKFQKVRQVWLLHNMFNVSLVDDELFEILLRYLEPLKGNSREATVKAAEKVMEDLEKDDNSDDPVKEERAKHVIQLLS